MAATEITVATSTVAELLTHPLAQRLTWTLAHFLWQGFLIAALLVLIVELPRVRRANVRYLCSLGALLLMIAMLPLTWLASGEATASSLTSATSLPLATAALNAPLPAPSPSQLWWPALQPALLTTWLLGCLLFNARIVVGWLALRRLLGQRQVLPPEVAARLARLGSQFRLSIPRVVFTSERASEAVAAGFFRPVVLLPAAWLLELPPNLLEAIVAHELAHVRRFDLWVNLLQRLAEAVLFYHPALWWLSARLRRERELCCDELAVAATGERLHYVEALELTARWALVDGRPALAAGFMGDGKMNLLHRVRSVLGMSRERSTSLWPASLMLGTLSLLLLAAVYTASGNAQDEAPPTRDEERKREEPRPDRDRPRADGDRPRADGERRREGDGERSRDSERPRADERNPLSREDERTRPLGERVRPDSPRPDAARREGDRPRPEGDSRRGGDRLNPNEAVRRDGDQLRLEIEPRLNGEGRRNIERRLAIPAEPRPPIEFRNGPMGDGQSELIQMIRELRAEVRELSAEVARLRNDRSSGGRSSLEPSRPRLEGEPRSEFRAQPRREGDRPRFEDRPDAEERPRFEDRPRLEDRREGERRHPADARPRLEGGEGDLRPPFLPEPRLPEPKLQGPQLPDLAPDTNEAPLPQLPPVKQQLD